MVCYFKPSSSSRNGQVDGINVFENIRNEIIKYANICEMLC